MCAQHAIVDTHLIHLQANANHRNLNYQLKGAHVMDLQ